MVTGGAAQSALAAAILSAILATLLLIMRRRRVIIKDAMGKWGIPLGDVDAALIEEDRLEELFRAKAEKRVKRQLKLALAAPDDSARAAAIEALLKREQRYANQRAVAAANRVLASAEREVLRRTSPSGAYWKLGDRKVHTADCLAMAGKFWPWSILNIVHPLLHVGCGCSLKSYGWALANGLIGPGVMLGPKDQARIAGPVINHVRAHQAELDRLNEVERSLDTELSARERLSELGHDRNVLAACAYEADVLLEAFDPDQPRWPKGHPRAGQWRPKIGRGSAVGNKTIFKAVQNDLGAHMTQVGSLGRLADSDDQAIKIGKKVIELADRFGTVTAYSNRLVQLDKKLKDEDAKIKADVIKVLGWDKTRPDLVTDVENNGAIGRITAGHSRWSDRIRDYMGDAYTDEMEQKITDLMLAKTKRTVPISMEQAKVRADRQKAHRDALVGVLSTQRGMGGSIEMMGMSLGDQKVKANGSGLMNAVKKDKPEVLRKAKEAVKYLPTEWLEAAATDHPTELAAGKPASGAGGSFHTISAGFDGHAEHRYFVQVPGDVTSSTMLHEVGHRMELLDMNGDGFPLAKYGEHWRDERADSKQTVQLSDYGRGVKGMLGPWRRQYTGRTYGAGEVHNEVLTTSLQELFYPSPSSDPGSDSADQAYWVAGLLAAY